MTSSSLAISNTYDAEAKIWSGIVQEDFYAKDISIGAIIFEEMRRHPNDIAQISPTENTILTRGELLENSIRVATFLRNQGVGQHDIVGIIARNTTHLAAVAYGCFFNGTAFHALNPNYDATTVQQLFGITVPNFIFCDGEDYEKVRKATETLKPQIYTMKDHIEGVPSILDILETPIDEKFRPAKLDKGMDQTLAIMCSSGTTSTPKAVTISNNRRIFHLNGYLNSTDVQLTGSTLDWVTGMIVLTSSGVYGTKRIIFDQPYDPSKFLQYIYDYKVTWIFQGPSLVVLLLNLKELTPEKLDSVRYYIQGGSRCSIQTMERLQAHLRHGTVLTFYGLTEMSGTITENDFQDNPRSVGRLVSNTKGKVINEEGVSLGVEEQGEICIYYDEYWGGYYKNEAETKKIRDAEGWFHTGDLGYFNKDNYLYITDRKKEMLKYNGIQYYPSEIEAVISQMPEVAEVCVFGVWKQVGDDAAGAVVVKTIGSELTAQDVIEYVAQNTDGNYKHLHAGALIVDDLKRNPNGKINRGANKAHFLDAINLNSF